MMRIGTPNGVLEPGQTEVVAEIAEEYATGPIENPEFGDAYVDWTTRQSIQLHWIKVEDAPEIFERLESVGLSTQQACGDSWRNIVGCPVAGKDRHEHVDALPVTEGLHETYKGHEDHTNLPRKWKVSVTGCREGCGQGDINDLADEVPGAIANLIEGFAARREGEEAFREFVERTDEETLTDLVAPEETSYDDPYRHNTKLTWCPYAEEDGMDAGPAPTDREGTPLADD
jgi:sulfite reductase beta subunit-like hemoprotein